MSKMLQEGWCMGAECPPAPRGKELSKVRLCSPLGGDRDRTGSCRAAVGLPTLGQQSTGGSGAADALCSHRGHRFVLTKTMESTPLKRSPRTAVTRRVSHKGGGCPIWHLDGKQAIHAPGEEGGWYGSVFPVLL